MTFAHDVTFQALHPTRGFLRDIANYHHVYTSSSEVQDHPLRYPKE